MIDIFYHDTIDQIFLQCCCYFVVIFIEYAYVFYG